MFHKWIILLTIILTVSLLPSKGQPCWWQVVLAGVVFFLVWPYPSLVNWVRTFIRAAEAQVVSLVSQLGPLALLMISELEWAGILVDISVCAAFWHYYPSKRKQNGQAIRQPKSSFSFWWSADANVFQCLHCCSRVGLVTLCVRRLRGHLRPEKSRPASTTTLIAEVIKQMAMRFPHVLAIGDMFC